MIVRDSVWFCMSHDTCMRTHMYPHAHPQLVSAYLSQRAKLLTAGKTPAEAAGHAAATAQAALHDVQRATALANDVCGMGGL